jgi:hypothetical protein
MTRQVPPGTASNPDVVVDLLCSNDVEYVAMNPGAGFPWLHDSLVNYGGDYRGCSSASMKTRPSRSRTALPRRRGGR